VSADDEPGSDDSGESVPGNLPIQLTRLVGRRDALGELRSLIWGTRLLTLCGPGGAGKTRLAVALAEAVREDFVGGAWWVDLSAALDPGLVAQVAAATLLPAEPASEPTMAIARRFGESSLLVLDNCEQVVDACAELVVNLLSRSASLRVVATSRQPLGVPGEQVFRVPGLVVDHSVTTEVQAPDGDAVDLFLERAREAMSSFDPEARSVRDAVTRICSWLDGMPLAIELAAARVPVLGVAQIADRLERDSGFLRHTSRAAPARHRTLQDTLDWSHRMLEPSEQRLFRRLGAFRGSFSLAAAEAVCAGDALTGGELLDLLVMLVDRSLVQVLDSGDEPRYRLLSTVHQYAAAKLAQSGETDAIRGRHARFYISLTELAQFGLSGKDQVRWLERLELEHDNLSEALHWQLGRSAQDAARLASLLWPFWYQRGYYDEARMWFDHALASSAEMPAAARADALTKAGEVAFLQCDYALAGEHLRAALELIDELEDQRTAATVFQRLGSIAREQGRYGEARELHQRSLEICEQLSDRRGIAASHNYLGFVAWLSGDFSTAESMCATALAEFEQSGNLEDAAVTLVSLGAAALYRGELELAGERLDRALSISRRLGFQEGIAWSLHELAIAARSRRQPTREQALMLLDALLVHRQLGDRWRVASVLEEIAGSLLARQDPHQAVMILASAAALREKLGTPVPPAELQDRDGSLTRLQTKLSRSAFSSAWAQGRAQELDQTIDSAVETIAQLDAATSENRNGQTAPILTARELAVLELLSDGQTNREIAASLYISPSTAGVHVSNILRKLGAKRRVDAAGLAHTMGLLPTR
jgi:predicted ATPase/DNA-binding CsgD family transcriptional regulator